MNHEIKICFEQYGRANDKALDWLILSWKKEDKYDRQICRIKYKKYSEERRELAMKLARLTNGSR